MEHKAEKSKETTPTSNESKGVLGSVWSAAGAIAETVQHAVQGTIEAAYNTADRIQYDAETVSTVGSYMASTLVDKARHTADSLLPAAKPVGSSTASTPVDEARHTLPAAKPEVKVDPTDAYFSSPTNDMMEASKKESEKQPLSKTASDAISDATAKTGELYESAKKAVSDTLSSVSSTASGALESAKQTVSDATSSVTTSASGVLESAKQTVSDATSSISAEKLLDSANKIASSNIDSASNALNSVSLDSATEVAKDALSSVTDALQKTGLNTEVLGKLELTMDIVAHLQRIADRTGDKILHETARKAHSACAKGLSEAPGVHLVRITPDQATELVNLAILTQDHELADFARYCQSVAATTQVGIEPSPGKIQEELAKGRQELSQGGRMHTGPGYGAAFASVGRANAANPQGQGQTQQAQSTPADAASADSSSEKKLTMEMVAHIQRIADRTGDAVLHETARKAHSACAKGLSEAPGVHLVSVTPDQASELVNLAIRTQDHELANFARYCQSVAATSQLGIEPTPGKIVEEINKGRQELQQGGRAHTGPGYGAAFASISRSNSAQNLGRTSRSSSPTNVPITPAQEQIATSGQQPQLQLTMDVVAHLQRIADRTGDELLHETARRAHSACAKNLNEAPGVHLTWVTPEQATELVNLAIRTQDTELADFARYCQSVAATTQIAVEPSPGKILEEIEKGRQELLQQGRTHSGPGYGAAFASRQPVSRSSSKTDLNAQPDQSLAKTEPETTQQPALVGLPSQ